MLNHSRFGVSSRKCSLHATIRCANVITSFCSPQLSVILVFCLTAILSAFVFHDHHHRKMFVGSIGLAASIAMYGSPLVVMVSNFLLE